MLKRLDNYELLTQIGSGGTGIVYHARDLLLGRDVALKLLNFELLSDPLVRQRFLREAELASELNHPNIVAIYSTGQNPPYIAMQYLAGGSLRARLSLEGRLSSIEVTGISIQAAEALAEAHRHGIIHRDIKPENLLFDSLGQVKVVDFGIAKAASQASMTLTGQAFGTLEYMSPEQAMPGHGELGAQCDIYSMGVMLFEMATGRVPFGGGSPTDIIEKHLSERPEPPSGIVTDINPALEEIILGCLNKDPHDRFANGSELFIALQGIGTKQPPHRPRVRKSIPTKQKSSLYKRNDRLSSKVIVGVVLPALIVIAGAVLIAQRVIDKRLSNAVAAPSVEGRAVQLITPLPPAEALSRSQQQSSPNPNALRTSSSAREVQRKVSNDVGKGIAQSSTEQGERNLSLPSGSGSNEEGQQSSVSTLSERSMADFKGTVRRYSPPLREMYDERRRERPDISGQVRVLFSIRGDGAVVGCSITESSIDDEKFLDAIIGQMRTWKFGVAGPADGVSEFLYPFEFSP